ncbi:MAG: hypothetical protein AAGN82_14680 [Myxococcota bacterium]
MPPSTPGFLMFISMFVATLAGCDDDDGGSTPAGNPSGGNQSTTGSGAGRPNAPEIQTTLEACCDDGGQFDTDAPVCADVLARSGLDPVDFCLIEWPPQTPTPSEPFGDPICDLDCNALTSPGIIGCVDGPFAGSFSYEGRNAFDLTVRMGEPFGWALRRTGGNPGSGSSTLRYEYIIAGPGSPLTGTYPLRSSGVAFIQAGYFSENIPEPRPTYFYKSEDILGTGEMTFFEAPAATGDVVSGAFDYQVNIQSFLTTEITDPMPAGTARFQACFRLTAIPG